MQVSRSASVEAAVPRRACRIPALSVSRHAARMRRASERHGVGAELLHRHREFERQWLRSQADGRGDQGTKRGPIRYSYKSAERCHNAAPSTKSTPPGRPASSTHSSVPTAADPVGELVLGADGHIYGTTWLGGPNVDTGIASGGTGTVFRISMPGEVFSMIHAFAPFDTVTGRYPEGLGPYAGLTLGNDNNLYGTTASGGTGQCGTIFRVTPAGVLTTLHSLQTKSGRVRGECGADLELGRELLRNGVGCRWAGGRRERIENHASRGIHQTVRLLGRATTAPATPRAPCRPPNHWTMEPATCTGRRLAVAQAALAPGRFGSCPRPPVS